MVFLFFWMEKYTGKPTLFPNRWRSVSIRWGYKTTIKDFEDTTVCGFHYWNIDQIALLVTTRYSLNPVKEYSVIHLWERCAFFFLTSLVVKGWRDLSIHVTLPPLLTALLIWHFYQTGALKLSRFEMILFNKHR